MSADIIVNTIFWKDGTHTVLHLDRDDTAKLNKAFVNQGIDSSKPVINVFQRKGRGEPFYVHVLISHVSMIWENGEPRFLDELF